MSHSCLPSLLVKTVTSLCSLFHQLHPRGCTSQPECTQSLPGWPGSYSWCTVQHCSFGETERPAGSPLPLPPCCRGLLKPSARGCARSGHRKANNATPALMDKEWCGGDRCLVSPIPSTIYDSMSAYRGASLLRDFTQVLSLLLCAPASSSNEGGDTHLL